MYMEKNYRLPFKIVEDSHLRNILDHDLFLELGIIDVSVIRRLLTFEVIDIDEVTFFPIQNKGLGHGLNKDEVLKNNIPFYFYRKLMEGNPLLQLTISYGLYCYRDFGKMDKFAPIILIPITMFYENDKTYIKMISR